MVGNAVRAAAFAIRCAGSCATAYALALELGLDKALWAAMSAAIVSQERLNETRTTFASRIGGTCLGVAISVAVGALGTQLNASVAVEMPTAVAVAALFAHRFPSLRVAMWTCPLVLMTAEPSEPLLTVAAKRASEVVLGACVGWAFHRAFEAFGLSVKAADPPQG